MCQFASLPSLLMVPLLDELSERLWFSEVGPDFWFLAEGLSIVDVEDDLLR